MTKIVFHSPIQAGQSKSLRELRERCKESHRREALVFLKESCVAYVLKCALSPGSEIELCAAGAPPYAVVETVFYSDEWRAYGLVLSHHSFPLVRRDEELPVLDTHAVIRRNTVPAGKVGKASMAVGEMYYWSDRHGRYVDQSGLPVTAVPSIEFDEKNPASGCTWPKAVKCEPSPPPVTVELNPRRQEASDDEEEDAGDFFRRVMGV